MIILLMEKLELEYTSWFIALLLYNYSDEVCSITIIMIIISLLYVHSIILFNVQVIINNSHYHYNNYYYQVAIIE